MTKRVRILGTVVLLLVVIGGAVVHAQRRTDPPFATLYFCECSGDDNVSAATRQWMEPIGSMNDRLAEYSTRGYRVVDIIGFQGAPNDAWDMRRVNHVVVVLRK